ncbi:hypothetical protein ABFU82_14995 [Nocardioides sp. WV_118_6]
MSGRLRRLGFLLPPAAQALVVLVSLPVMLGALGPAGWSSVAVAQTVGGLCGTVIALGWGVSGPARVGRAVAPATVLSEASWSKALVAGPVVLVGVGVALLLHPGGPGGPVALGVTSTAVLGLAQTWYFVAADDVRRLLLLDTLPRLVLGLAGWAAVAGGADVRVGLATQTAAALVGFALCWARITRPARRTTTLRACAAVVLGQRFALATQVLGSAFLFGPLLVLAPVHPAALAVFGLVDRVQRQLVTASIPLGNVVLARRMAHERRTAGPPQVRVGRRLLDVALVAAGCGLAAGALAVPLLAYLGAGAVRVPVTVALLMGVVVAGAVATLLMPTMVHAPLGRERRAVLAAATGVLVGMPAVALLGAELGALGAQVGIVAGQAAALVAYLAGLRGRPETTVAAR